MILANVIFGSRRRNEPDQLEDVAESYLGALFHSGQLCGEYFLTWTRGRLNAHVLLAGRAATEPRYHSRYGKKELKKVTDAFGREPVCLLCAPRVSAVALRPGTGHSPLPFIRRANGAPLVSPG
jgi:hypothetical protein